MDILYLFTLSHYLNDLIWIWYLLIWWSNSGGRDVKAWRQEYERQRSLPCPSSLRRGHGSGGHHEGHGDTTQQTHNGTRITIDRKWPTWAGPTRSHTLGQCLGGGAWGGQGLINHLEDVPYATSILPVQFHCCIVLSLCSFQFLCKHPSSS